MDLSDGILVGASLALAIWSIRHARGAVRVEREAQALMRYAEDVIREERSRILARFVNPVYTPTALEGRLADVVGDWNTSVAVSPDGFAVITRQQGRC